MRKIKNSPRKNILAISIFIFSILLSSCKNSVSSESSQSNVSSINNEIKFIPASKEQMNLYRQIGVSYLCLARQAKVEFPQAISIASNNFVLLVSQKHGGFIQEIGDKNLTNEQIYQGSYLQLIEGAIQLCPDQVPEEDKTKFSKALEKLNQKE